MYTSFRNTIFLIITLFFIVSCKEEVNKIDISNIDLELNIIRFEKELMNINLDSIEYEIPKLQNKYSYFFDIFNHKIINIGGTNVREYPNSLRRFLSDYLIKEVYEKSRTKFSSFDKIENELTDAFKHYKYYFPKKEIPSIYTYISGFNQSIVTSDDFIAIGLDKYFGANCKYYSKLAVPNFSRKNMIKEKITVDAMFAWSSVEFPYNDSVDNLLSQMIHNGKILYLLDKIIPEKHDSLKIGYTKHQLEWAKSNEKRMWTFLVENKMLFKSDYMEMKSFINDGPFTKSFSQNSPPKTGVWIGWQIVRSYMENNKISIDELMNNDDYQKILNKSKYRP